MNRRDYELIFEHSLCSTKPPISAGATLIIYLTEIISAGRS